YDGVRDTVGIFTGTGDLASTVILPVASLPTGGTTVGPDGVLYVAVSNGVARISQSGSLLNLISFPSPAVDLVVSPKDGTLWLAEGNGSVWHINMAGSVIGGFGTGLFSGAGSIGIAPDGNSIYCARPNLIRHFSIDGTFLDQFSILAARPEYLT